MAQLTESLVRCILNGGCITRGEIEQLCRAWLNARPAPTEAEVEAAAIRIAGVARANIPWSELCSETKSMARRMARAALGVDQP